MTPIFSWTASADAVRYDLSVVNSSGQVQVIRQQDLTTTSFTATTGLAVGSYDVQVTWPTGKTQHFQSLPMDGLYGLREGDPTPHPLPLHSFKLGGG